MGSVVLSQQSNAETCRRFMMVFHQVTVSCSPVSRQPMWRRHGDVMEAASCRNPVAPHSSDLEQGLHGTIANVTSVT
jgi:hypothetical protein